MALIFGIVGIVRDQRKLVALAAALVAGALILFFLASQL
jgi:hypothetical protein